ncbi:MFS transporter [Pseudonocardia sulfidoxydans]|uniref:MFS transporter n=1 Tax=Pseudonocardia sulfidoxydans TaxID=54011 RepID=UPI0011BF9AF0
MAVAFLADLVPVYALYAVWFVATGLSEAQVSALFAIWSVVGLVAEVPSGALADRFGRRRAVVTAYVGQAAAYAVWALWPTFTGFAAGFALWSLGGSLESGAKEALLYDALAPGERWRYARIASGSSAAGLLAQVPGAALATLLWATGGGFAPVAWLSVGTCLVTAALATRLPEVRPEPSDPAGDEPEPGWFAALRAGVAEAAAHPPVRAVLLAVAVLGGVDALEEYFPLLAADWSVPTSTIPAAVVATAVTGAAGAALGGAAAGWGRWRLTATIAAAVVALVVAATLAVPLAMVLVAVFYGGYRLVLVVLEVRLQDRITGPSRATVTSVSGFATEVVGLAVFGAWAVGGIWPVVAAAALVTVLLPRVLRTP